MGNKVEKFTEAINYSVTALMPANEPSEAELKAAEERRRLRERRSHIAQEILATEQNYVKTLTELFTKWETPLRKALETKAIISKEEIRNIFSNSEVLMGFHQMLLTSLDERITNWSDGTEIGIVFLEKAPVLKLYVEYVNNYDNSVKTIADCLANKNFENFLIETVGLVDTYPLSTLLIQPIQRIPRYEMLLSDLVKNTWENHPDMESLQKALALIKANAQFVNAQKKRFEDSQKLLEIQTKVGMTDLFVPHRGVVLDNDLLLSKNGKPSVAVKCCLLNDSLLIWEATEKSLFNLRQGKVHVFQELSIVEMKDINQECVTFFIEKDEYGLYFPPESKMTKEVWIKEFNATLLSVLKIKSAPVIIEEKAKKKPQPNDKKLEIFNKKPEKEPEKKVEKKPDPKENHKKPEKKPDPKNTPQNLKNTPKPFSFSETKLKSPPPEKKSKKPRTKNLPLWKEKVKKKGWKNPIKKCWKNPKKKWKKKMEVICFLNSPARLPPKKRKQKTKRINLPYPKFCP